MALDPCIILVVIGYIDNVNTVPCKSIYAVNSFCAVDMQLLTSQHNVTQVQNCII
jgi:hypothetical protein